MITLNFNMSIIVHQMIKTMFFYLAKDNTIIDITVIIQLTDLPHLNMNVIKLDYNMMEISGWIIKLLSTFGLSSAG
jgi:hypothetical protein